MMFAMAAKELAKFANPWMNQLGRIKPPGMNELTSS